MVKVSIVWKTMMVTKNPVAVLSMKTGNCRKTVTFRNGSTFNLSWPQFRLFRDYYPVLAGHSIAQVGDDSFKVCSAEGTVVCGVQLLPLVCSLMGDFAITQTGHDTFHIKNGSFQVEGTAEMLVCIKELMAGEYDCDCKGKIVLDVGGFQGESAAYFWSKEASRIIIFEPVREHVKWIEKNIQLNNMDAEVHCAGVGSRNGKRTVRCDRTSIGFGLTNEGSRSVEIKLRDVSEVLSESGADLAKFDCEGAEESLLHVPSQTLRKIKHYIIEVHSPEVRQAILEKFTRAGFRLDKERVKSKFSILTFKL